MNDKSKYPKDTGRPIRVKKAKAEQKRWEKNPENKKYPSGSFAVPVEILSHCISDPKCNGVQFCNGLDKNSKYYAVMGVVTEDGSLLSAFDSKDIISEDEFINSRQRWESVFPTIEGNTQFFYLGEEAIKANIADFEVNKYEAAFVEKSDGTNSGLLYGFHLDGMKDPVDDDPDTALNMAKICPPLCEGE